MCEASFVEEDFRKTVIICQCFLFLPLSSNSI
uniref:BLTX653 n=1 Tax=Nephila pilipes TaxID=299642 RepID=A0A076L2Z5_NEPPI|nr:BLTX653 [Nephila pilipes]